MPRHRPPGVVAGRVGQPATRSTEGRRVTALWLRPRRWRRLRAGRAARSLGGAGVAGCGFTAGAGPSRRVFPCLGRGPAPPPGTRRRPTAPFRKASAAQYGMPTRRRRDMDGVASVVVEEHSAREEEVTTAGAAALTGLSPRQIQRLAKSGLGRRVGRSWLRPVDLLLADIASRKGNDGTAT